MESCSGVFSGHLRRPVTDRCKQGAREIDHRRDNSQRHENFPDGPRHSEHGEPDRDRKNHEGRLADDRASSAVTRGTVFMPAAKIVRNVHAAASRDTTRTATIPHLRRPAPDIMGGVAGTLPSYRCPLAGGGRVFGRTGRTRSACLSRGEPLRSLPQRSRSNHPSPKRPTGGRLAPLRFWLRMLPRSAPLWLDPRPGLGAGGWRR